VTDAALNAGSAPGPTVVVTRPQPQADAWVAGLHAAGVAAVALPLLEIRPVADQAPLSAVAEDIAAVSGLNLPGDATRRWQALVMFVSPNAALQWFQATDGSRAWPEAVCAAATGSGTVAVLRAHGVPLHCIVAPAEGEGHDSEHLWPHLATQRWRGLRAWILRGNGGRDWLADQLTADGAIVQRVQVYERALPLPDARFLSLADMALATPTAYRWLLSSSEAVAGLPRLLPRADWSAATALVSHPRIAERARQIGFGMVRLVPPGMDAVVDAVRGG